MTGDGIVVLLAVALYLVGFVVAGVAASRHQVNHRAPVDSDWTLVVAFAWPIVALVLLLSSLIYAADRATRRRE